MKRLSIMLAMLIASQALPGATFAQATPSPKSTTRYDVETLGADWIMPTKRKADFDWIVVRVIRRKNLDTGKVELFGSAGVGSCSGDGSGAFACAADLSSYLVLKFETDGAFRSAKVVLKRGGKRHTISWTAGIPYAFAPPVGVTPEPCPGGKEGTLTRVYMLAHNATAEGRVFGRRLSTADEYDEQRESEDMLKTIDVRDCP